MNNNDNTQGTQGSGVASGWSGGGGQQTQGGQGEKQDWLDKGIARAGNKLGINVVCRLSQWLPFSLLTYIFPEDRTKS